MTTGLSRIESDCIVLIPTEERLPEFITVSVPCEVHEPDSENSQRNEEIAQFKEFKFRCSSMVEGHYKINEPYYCIFII